MRSRPVEIKGIIFLERMPTPPYVVLPAARFAGILNLFWEEPVVCPIWRAKVDPKQREFYSVE